MSGLVYIGKVVSVEPIPNADKIMQLDVILGAGGRWHGCAPIGQFSAGDTCQVYLQDSLLPQTDEFSFMEKYHYRVRMVRLRGIPSECLIVPQTLPGLVGDDITELADVTKYEKSIPLSASGEIYGAFPTFIPKTDEPLFQRVPEMIQALWGKPFYATIKHDGASVTAYKWQDHFGICSRNWELKPSESNIMWQIAKRYNLEESLPDGFSVQWETIGPGIQNNPVGLKIPDMRCFNVYDITNKRYLRGWDALMFCNDRGLPFVEFILRTSSFNLSGDDLRTLAEKQVYSNGKPAEGIVIRPTVEETVIVDNEPCRLSFKVLNLLYHD